MKHTMKQNRHINQAICNFFAKIFFFCIYLKIHKLFLKFKCFKIKF